MGNVDWDLTKIIIMTFINSCLDNTFQNMAKTCFTTAK